MINFKHFGKKYVWKTVAVAGVLALLLAVTGLVSAPRADAGEPQFSLDVEAFCGSPYVNVAVMLTDVSDDNGPADPQVGLLTIECLAAVKSGVGRPDQINFATIQIPDPGFGFIEVECPMGSLPPGATEWKATATASDGDVRRPVSDTCEEVPFP